MRIFASQAQGTAIENAFDFVGIAGFRVHHHFEAAEVEIDH